MKKLNLLLTLIIMSMSNLQGQEAQYDESKVQPYTLPELLKTGKGKEVLTARQWENKRRPEILALFEEQVYGKTPSAKIPLRFEVRSVEEHALEGKATRKEIRIYLGKDTSRSMNLLLYLPNSAEQPVPVFLGLNFIGNQTIHPDPGISISNRKTTYGNDPGFKNGYGTEESRGLRIRRWPVEEILARGYGLATIYYGDIQPDWPGSFNEGVHSLFFKPGQEAPGPAEWGAIGAWAWGMSRALDYLEKDPGVNARQVAAIGHSRLGKAALWAGAQDHRFALVISNNSGEGGAAITRRKFGETIQDINTRFPHWFCGNYKQYNGREEALPVDYHQLLALIAPRPVYVASASEDL
ncbi:MAG TPA: acetylxylan esterase, partial [Anseongella sp.]|nr:acetylxylan esterase [Anseongella sp.]